MVRFFSCEFVLECCKVLIIFGKKFLVVVGIGVNCVCIVDDVCFICMNVVVVVEFVFVFVVFVVVVMQ